MAKTLRIELAFRRLCKQQGIDYHYVGGRLSVIAWEHYGDNYQEQHLIELLRCATALLTTTDIVHSGDEVVFFTQMALWCANDDNVYTTMGRIMTVYINNPPESLGDFLVNWSE